MTRETSSENMKANLPLQHLVLCWLDNLFYLPREFYKLTKSQTLSPISTLPSSILHFLILHRATQLPVQI